MANVVLVKPLVESILHLKACKKDSQPPCSDCVLAATRLAAVLADSTEVAEYLRNLAKLYESTVSAPKTISSGDSAERRLQQPR